MMAEISADLCLPTNTPEEPVILDNDDNATSVVGLVGGWSVSSATTNEATAKSEKNTLQAVQSSSATNRTYVFGGVAEVKNEIIHGGGSASASANGIDLTNGSYRDIYGGKADVHRRPETGKGCATASNNGEYTYIDENETEVTHKGVLTNVTASTFFGGSASAYNIANASANKFTMINGSYIDATGGKAHISGVSIDDKATAQHNKITLKDGIISSSVTGAFAWVDYIGTATASYNSVDLDNATLSTGAVVYGGRTLVYETSSDTSTATAEKNTLHIVQTSESAKKAGNVFGGLAEVKSTKDGNNLTASANGVDMTNGTYTNIYGGQAVLSGKGTVTASNNGAYTYTDDDETEVTHKGELTNVTANQFVGGLAQATGTSATASANIFTLSKGTYDNATGGKAEITAGTSSV